MLEVVSPYTGEPVGQLATHDLSELEAMLATAHGLFRDRSAWLSVHERVTVLTEAARLLNERPRPRIARPRTRRRRARPA